MLVWLSIHSTSPVKTPPHPIEASTNLKAKETVAVEPESGAGLLNKRIESRDVSVQEGTNSIFKPSTVFYTLPTTETVGGAVANSEYTLDYEMEVSGLAIVNNPKAGSDGPAMQAVTMLINNEPTLMFTDYNAANDDPLQDNQSIYFDEFNPHLTVYGAFMTARPIPNPYEPMEELQKGDMVPVGMGIPTDNSQ